MKSYVRKTATGAWTLLVTGCVSNWEPLPTEYVFRDWPSEDRVEVQFTNTTNGKLCLDPEHWPNQAGKINQASEYVYLEIDGKQFPIVDFNTGYCFGGCPTVVLPGETASASIAYRDFRLPGSLRHEPKRLEFPVVAYTCPFEQ